MNFFGAELAARARLFYYVNWLSETEEFIERLDLSNRFFQRLLTELQADNWNIGGLGL